MERRWRQATDRLRAMTCTAHKPVSLANPAGSENDTTLEDCIGDEQAPPDDVLSTGQLRENLYKILAEINETERKVIELRYSLTDGIGPMKKSRQISAYARNICAAQRIKPCVCYATSDSAAF